MKTKVIQLILLASIPTLVWGSAAWAGERSRERSQQRIQEQTRRVERGVRNNNNQRYANLSMNTNQSRVQRKYDRRENRQVQRIRKGGRNGEMTRNEYRRLHKEQRRFDRAYGRPAFDGDLKRHHSHYKWGRHVTRYHGHPKRHHYWNHRKRHPRPVVYTYHGRYLTQSYPRVGYELSGSINEPGWTLALSTGGNW
jgi:hypothetical protein